MKTTKPISSISYNTDEFLKTTLDNLVKLRKVAFYSFVNHKGETLDDGTIEKDHKHVYIEPNEKLDTMDLQDLTKEYDPLHPDKPLKCINFRRSQWDDWYLYGCHDPFYLATKFEVREYAYTDQDFTSSDADEFEVRAYDSMHSSAFAKQNRVFKALRKGVTISDMAMAGALPVNQMAGYMALAKLSDMAQYHTDMTMDEVWRRADKRQQARIIDEMHRREILEQAHEHEQMELEARNPFTEDDNPKDGPLGA